MSLILTDVSPKTTAHDLEEVFDQVKVPFSVYGHSIGTYQIDFGTNKDAIMAYNALNGRYLNSVPLNMIYSPIKEPLKFPVLYVSNVSPRVSKQDLEGVFGGYGKVIVDKVNVNVWKLTYDDVRDARDAVRGMQGREIYDSAIHIGPDTIASGEGIVPIPQVPTVLPKLSVPSVPSIGGSHGTIELDISGILRLPQGGTIELTPTKISIPVTLRQ
jgi:RNA recognition motif-containing protein